MTAQETELATLFLSFSRRKLLEQYWPRLRACVEPLTEEQVWWRPNEASNSIANLILHLNGNVTQWLVVSFNREADLRERPAEFNATGGITAAALLQRLGATGTSVVVRLSAFILLCIGVQICWNGIHGLIVAGFHLAPPS